MELSKEVHGLLDRIKKLSNTQKIFRDDTCKVDIINTKYSDEIEYLPEDIIPLDEFDTSNRETWFVKILKT